MERIRHSPGWLKGLCGEHVPKEYGIRSFVYRARRPFHPERLHSVLLGATLQQMLRAKGAFWLASRLGRAGILQKTGRFVAFGPGPVWLVAIPPDERPQTPEMFDHLERYWDAAMGDCQRELVFIGINMDETAIRSALDQALLTEVEMALGPEHWFEFHEPFPVWPRMCCEGGTLGSVLMVCVD